MAATQIQEVRYPHEAVLDFIISNPFATLKVVSKATGYSVSWLSQMIRSDCFRQAYDKRRGPIEAGIMDGISERMNSLTHLAIDNMEELLTKNIDADTTIDAFDKVLKANGYGPNSKAGAAPPSTTNVFLVEKNELAELRGRILEGTANPVSEVLPAPDDAPTA